MGWFLAVVMLLAGGVPVEGSPIVRRDWSGADRPPIQEWSRYLRAGPSVWVRGGHPPLTPAIQASIWKSLRTATSQADPMIRFLLWRLDIAPHRFAHFHPRLAPILTRISQTPLAPQQLAPPPAPLPPSTQQGTPLPPSVPEPGTCLLAVVLTAWAAWRGLRQRAQS
jgi:hypothetical protein